MRISELKHVLQISWTKEISNLGKTFNNKEEKWDLIRTGSVGL